MVSDETLDKLGVTLISLTVLNILGLLIYIIMSGVTEQNFGKEMSSITLGPLDLIINISNICYIDLVVIIFQLILLFIISNKKAN
jgi:hypothetical protein